MLNFYVSSISSKSDIQKYEEILKGKIESGILRGFEISQNYEQEHKRQKLIISSLWDRDALTSLYYTESGRFVQNTVHNAQKYLEKAIEDTSDLYLVLSTKTVYEQDVMAVLIDFLKHRKYTKSLIEVFITVLQELITNAVIHGNLGLNLYLKAILDPTEFNPEKTEQLQETFMKIQTMLDNPDYGEKPIALRINCFDKMISIDIQDQGPGFDFEEFQKKYGDTKLVKGMDLVFLMSKDMQYDSQTKTMSIILEDPEKALPQELDIHSDKIRIGIYTKRKEEFETVQSLLLNAGFQNIGWVSPNEKKVSTLPDTLDLLIMLSDISFQEMWSNSQIIREHSKQSDFPILCQKSEYTSVDELKELSLYVNDFLSSDILIYEFVSRIKAHLSMAQAKKNFTKFYSNYKSEIIQSHKTIEHIEKIQPSILRDETHRKKIWMLLNGSQTVIEQLEDKWLFHGSLKIPYGNGFSFDRGKQKHIVFISMKNGLSSVLVASYLKGYVERLKEGMEQLTPLQIINRVEEFVEEILPISVSMNIFCISWDAVQEELQFDQKGSFTIVKYDFLTDTWQTIDKKNNAQNSFSLHEKQIIYIFDATIDIDYKQFLTLSRCIAGKENEDMPSLENAKIDLYSESKIKIPYLMILPYKKQGTQEWI